MEKLRTSITLKVENLLNRCFSNAVFFTKGSKSVSIRSVNFPDLFGLFKRQISMLTLRTSKPALSFGILKIIGLSSNKKMPGFYALTNITFMAYEQALWDFASIQDKRNPAGNGGYSIKTKISISGFVDGSGPNPTSTRYFAYLLQKLPANFFHFARLSHENCTVYGQNINFYLHRGFVQWA